VQRNYEYHSVAR